MKERYYSLDVFRGATVALMILVNNPGSWSHIYGPLKHAPWHGCTPTDLVFPFFLFAVGNAMAFVMPRLQEAGAPVFWRKVLKRFLLIFLIGLFLNWSPFVKWSAENTLVFKYWVDPNKPDSGIRILGVLQRIALAYLFASILVFFTKPRLGFVISASILLLYWAMAGLLGDPADPYSLQGFVGTQFDIDILGKAHVYKGEGVPFDPEGIISTIPAIVQVVFGYFTGQYIQQKGKNFDMLEPLSSVPRRAYGDGLHRSSAAYRPTSPPPLRSSPNSSWGCVAWLRRLLHFERRCSHRRSWSIPRVGVAELLLAVTDCLGHSTTVRIIGKLEGC
ncbi:MAG: heparan-alpha-glucosaminide N-acetyltransferase domain-containing protein [Chitinophagaceae bacterium]|nr:heparan-alpha-glucosaminide N-acetyltransferase domain-containing protein [Chitinophagaceae bacterium]